MTSVGEGGRPGRAMAALALALGGLASMVAPSRAGTVSPATEELLRSSSYIYTATQRKDGSLSSFAPVWFAWDGGRIFFTTEPDSWKARRIARGSALTIRVGSKTGPTLVGRPARVTDPALVDRMGQAYSAKYWIAWLGLFRPRSSRVSAGKTVAYLVDVEEQR
jgi:PPOX class probable F420-dependent enzyme